MNRRRTTPDSLADFQHDSTSFRILGVVAVLAAAAMSMPVQAGDRLELDGENPRIEVLTLVSTHQSSPNRVVIILPPDYTPDKHYRSLYVLPVEPREQQRWGHPIKLLLDSRAVRDQELICIYPTFSDLPWYADHPSDASIAQESFLVDSVIPLVESRYRFRRRAEDRFLVGFSKSGWGAMSLLFRHPDTFSAAAAWDAPLMMDAPGRYGSGPIFGTPENFQHYQVSRLVELNANADSSFHDRLRLFHAGFDNFRDHHLAFEQLLLKHRIQHVFVDGPSQKHHWQSGWFDPLVQTMLTMTPAD